MFVSFPLRERAEKLDTFHSKLYVDSLPRAPGIQRFSVDALLHSVVTPKLV